MSTAMPADWATYEALAEGIDAHRLPASDRLRGSVVVLDTEDGGSWRLAFDGDGGVAWRHSPAAGPATEGSDDADVVEVNPGTFFVDVWLRSLRAAEAVTFLVSTVSGRALVVLTHVRDHHPEGEPRVAQSFAAGVIRGVTTSGAAPALTRDLIGRRLFNDYSPRHHYEHVYLNSGRYVWQCFAGVQRGHGDCDLATYHRFAQDQYVFCFREFRIPVASVLFLDFTTMRNTGKFFGVEGDGRLSNAGCGAIVRWLGEGIDYPNGSEPA